MVDWWLGLHFALCSSSFCQLILKVFLFFFTQDIFCFFGHNFHSGYHDVEIYIDRDGMGSKLIVKSTFSTICNLIKCTLKIICLHYYRKIYYGQWTIIIIRFLNSINYFYRWIWDVLILIKRMFIIEVLVYYFN